MSDVNLEVTSPAAPEQFKVTDTRGRIFTIRKPEFLSQFRLVEILGDTSRNETYMRMITPFQYISAIDGDPIFQPNTKRELDALIKRVGEEGFVAVAQCMAEHFAQSESHEEAVKND